MSLDSAYISALTVSSAILTTRMMGLHMLAIRSRLMSGYFVTKEDNPNDPLMPFVKTALLCFGSDFGGQEFVDRIMRITRNCAENEPHFMILALLCGLSGLVDTETGVKLIQIFTAARLAHTVAYLFGPIISGAPRSVFWTAGCMTTLYMAGTALLSATS